jgi:hypothetical protein
MPQAAEAHVPELVPEGLVPGRSRNRKARNGGGRSRFRRRLVVYLEDNSVSSLGEARRSRDHGGYRNWATQLRHLAGHLAGRNDLLAAGYLPRDIDAIVEGRAPLGNSAEITDKPETD